MDRKDYDSLEINGAGSQPITTDLTQEDTNDIVTEGNLFPNNNIKSGNNNNYNNNIQRTIVVNNDDNNGDLVALPDVSRDSRMFCESVDNNLRKKIIEQCPPFVTEYEHLMFLQLDKNIFFGDNETHVASKLQPAYGAHFCINVVPNIPVSHHPKYQKREHIGVFFGIYMPGAYTRRKFLHKISILIRMKDKVTNESKIIFHKALREEKPLWSNVDNDTVFADNGMVEALYLEEINSKYPDMDLEEIYVVCGFETVSYRDINYDSYQATSMVGLINLGATCYLNALLQMLFHLNGFRRVVYALPVSTEEVHNSTTLAMQKTFSCLQNDQTAVHTRDLTAAFGWNVRDAFTQQDVQEMMRVLMDKLEEKAKGTSVDGAIKKLFAGQYRSFIRCTNVDYMSAREEDFYDLQLDVKGCTTLNESFKKYVEKEMLINDNQYDAGEHGKQDAEKGVVFTEFPPILTIHLKRFDFDPTRMCFTKIHDSFEFPARLEVDDYLADDVEEEENENEKEQETNGTPDTELEESQTSSQKSPHLYKTEKEPNDEDSVRVGVSVSSSNTGQRTGTSQDNKDENDIDNSKSKKKKKNVYLLHSVLIHDGDVNSGHYYAYIRPSLSFDYSEQSWNMGDFTGNANMAARSGQWYKYDDEQVLKIKPRHAIESSFGCNEASVHNVHSAYMLVYIRESEAGEIMAPISEEDVPTELVERITAEARAAETHQKITAIKSQISSYNYFTQEDFREFDCYEQANYLLTHGYDDTHWRGEGHDHEKTYFLEETYLSIVMKMSKATGRMPWDLCICLLNSYDNCGDRVSRLPLNQWMDTLLEPPPRKVKDWTYTTFYIHEYESLEYSDADFFRESTVILEECLTTFNQMVSDIEAELAEVVGVELASSWVQHLSIGMRVQSLIGLQLSRESIDRCNYILNAVNVRLIEVLDQAVFKRNLRAESELIFVRVFDPEDVLPIQTECDRSIEPDRSRHLKGSGVVPLTSRHPTYEELHSKVQEVLYAAFSNPDYSKDGESGVESAGAYDTESSRDNENDASAFYSEFSSIDIRMVKERVSETENNDEAYTDVTLDRFTLLDSDNMHLVEQNPGCILYVHKKGRGKQFLRQWQQLVGRRKVKYLPHCKVDALAVKALTRNDDVNTNTNTDHDLISQETVVNIFMPVPLLYQHIADLIKVDKNYLSLFVGHPLKMDFLLTSIFMEDSSQADNPVTSLFDFFFYGRHQREGNCIFYQIHPMELNMGLNLEGRHKAGIIIADDRLRQRRNKFIQQKLSEYGYGNFGIGFSSGNVDSSGIDTDGRSAINTNTVQNLLTEAIVNKENLESGNSKESCKRKKEVAGKGEGEGDPEVSNDESQSKRLKLEEVDNDNDKHLDGDDNNNNNSMTHTNNQNGSATDIVEESSSNSSGNLNSPAQVDTGTLLQSIDPQDIPGLVASLRLPSKYALYYLDLNQRADSAINHQLFLCYDEDMTVEHIAMLIREQINLPIRSHTDIAHNAVYSQAAGIGMGVSNERGDSSYFNPKFTCAKNVSHDSRELRTNKSEVAVPLDVWPGQLRLGPICWRVSEEEVMTRVVNNKPTTIPINATSTTISTQGTAGDIGNEDVHLLIYPITVTWNRGTLSVKLPDRRCTPNDVLYPDECWLENYGGHTIKPHRSILMVMRNYSNTAVQMVTGTELQYMRNEMPNIESFPIVVQIDCPELLHPSVPFHSYVKEDDTYATLRSRFEEILGLGQATFLSDENAVLNNSFTFTVYNQHDHMLESKFDETNQNSPFSECSILMRKVLDCRNNYHILCPLTVTILLEPENRERLMGLMAEERTKRQRTAAISIN